jgi:pyrimidine deaminase RibD-like protein
MRFSDVVTEAFDKPYPYEWNKDDFGDYHALAFLDDGSPLELSFGHEGDDQWHVTFDRNFKFDVTGEGDQQRVFATVLAGVKDFVQQRHPQKIIFSATKSVKPGQKITSRAGLYNSLVNRYAAALGYTAHIDDRDDQVVYELMRIGKQPVAEGSRESKVAAMEKKLQDMQNRLELTRERRKMRGQRIQSTAEINLAAKMSELRQQIHQLKSNVTESASISTHGTTTGGYTWQFEPGREVPMKPDVDANTFIRVRDAAGKTIGGIWADVEGDSIQIEYSQVFDEQLRGRGVYTDVLRSLSKRYNVISDTDNNNAAAGIYRRLGADYDHRGARHTLRKQAVEEGKVKLYTDPSYFGAEVDDTGFDNLPIVNISANQLVGFEPDAKMNQPKSRANVEKIVAGLKQGAKLPPLLVRKYKNGYQVLDGHHRFWAYKLLGVKSIPSRIVPDEDIEEISKQGVAEGLDQDVPPVLYHATYKPRLKSIKLKGLGAGGKPNWEDSQRGVVYLALDPNVAESYAETSDMVPDEWLDQIVILKISTAGLDPNKFQIDSNVQDNEGDTVEYHGVIPLSNISLYKQGVAEGSENNNIIAQKIFFARSDKTPKGWSYDHVGFITQDGRQIQMSGHKGNDVYVTNNVTDDPEFPEQNIKIVSLSKPVSVPTTNSVGAENCGTFVANVLQANGIKGIDTQKIYSVFKQPQKQGVAEGRKKKNKKTSKYFGGYFFPGYGYYASGESGEGGGEGESVAEGAEQPNLMSAFRDFLPIAMRELDIDKLPPIRLLKQVPAGDQPTFGKFNNQENVIHLGIAERHPIDILRTLAHELVHYKQNTEHQLAAGSGATGSPEENQAHEVAGVIMRDFNRLHPEYFKSQAVELTEDRSDYEIRNREKLDNILVNLCRHVVEGQRVDSSKYGMVAACVVDPDNRQVIGVNELTADGTRRHGERVAIERYQEQYGDIPEGSIIVTTCSPCNEEHMPERYGESCTDIINNSNCRKVYCGYQDPSQTDEHNEFTMEVTGNADIVDLCEHFAATFLNENFADGKGPGRPGDSVRHGIPKNATMAELERASRAKGRKGQLARWQLNMRRGRNK